MLDWIATRDERLAILPGDELLPDVRGGSTHAISIGAAQEEIWPWLLQMGCDRAGWYSHDLLDNGGRPSADLILPELQQTKEGDILPNRPGSRDGFEVIRIDRPESFILGAFLEIPSFRSISWQEPRPERYVRNVWGFYLKKIEPDTTRLLVRVKGVTCPWTWRILFAYCMAPAHQIMQRKQLLNLRKRAEGLHAQGGLA